jgi:hypothetical protein
MTSELRELVCVPMASAASRTMTSPRQRQLARDGEPTIPAPMTAHSTCSVTIEFLDSYTARNACYPTNPRAMADYWTTEC